MTTHLVTPHLDRIAPSDQFNRRPPHRVYQIVVGALPLLSTFNCLKPLSAMLAIGHKFKVLSDQQGAERYLQAAGLVGVGLLSFISAPAAVLVSQGTEAWNAVLAITERSTRANNQNLIKPYLDLLTALLSCVAALTGAGLAVLLLANFAQVLKDSCGALELINRGATYEGCMLLLASTVRAAFTIGLGKQLISDWNRPSASRKVFEEIIETKKSAEQNLNLREELHQRGFSSSVSKQDLSNLDFSRTNFEGLRFDRCDFSNARFSHCHFTNSSFNYCRLDGASFGDSSLFNCQFHQCTGTGSHWERTSLHHVHMTESGWAGSDWTQCQVVDSDWSGINLCESQWAHCQVANSDLRRADFRESQWTYCEIKDSTLTAANLHRSTLQDCVICDSWCRDIRMTDSTCNRLEIRSSVFERADFTRSKINECLFRRVDLQFANMQASTLRQSEFYRSILAYSHLENSSLEDVSFRSSRFSWSGSSHILSLSQSHCARVSIEDCGGQLEMRAAQSDSIRITNSHDLIVFYSA